VNAAEVDVLGRLVQASTQTRAWISPTVSVPRQTPTYRWVTCVVVTHQRSGPSALTLDRPAGLDVTVLDALVRRGLAERGVMSVGCAGGWAEHVQYRPALTGQGTLAHRVRQMLPST
jgi:hypothetical protein